MDVNVKMQMFLLQAKNLSRWTQLQVILDEAGFWSLILPYVWNNNVDNVCPPFQGDCKSCGLMMNLKEEGYMMTCPALQTLKRVCK